MERPLACAAGRSLARTEGKLLARVAGAGAGRRAVSGLHRGKALGLGGNARSRTGSCGRMRRSSGAGRRRSERALGRSGLLGAASLTGLQLGSSTSGKGALRLATSLARHLSIGHHDGLLHRRCALDPGLHLRLRRHRNATGRPPASRWSGTRPTSSGHRARRGACGSRHSPPRGHGRATGRTHRHRSSRAPCGHGRASRSGRGGGSDRRRSRSGRCRPPPVSVAAGRVSAAPDDHLQFGHLATLGFQAVGHAAHTAVESRDPQAKGEHGHRQHTEAYSHQAERRRKKLKHGRALPQKTNS